MNVMVGRVRLSAHSVKALTTFYSGRGCTKADNYSQAKLLIDDLYKIYPVGHNAWWNVWTAPNGANVGTPHGYYGLRRWRISLRMGSTLILMLR
ncbi:MAG: hypothetical protein IPI90_20465 [Saprospiraceae bacterium]|nr:hypothetical protein [Candidatus Vicinibacter affinis]